MYIKIDADTHIHTTNQNEILLGIPIFSFHLESRGRDRDWESKIVNKNDISIPILNLRMHNN